jgi:hypothetical protein
MKLNEFVAAYYHCSFPARLNRAAIAYYRDNSQSARCYFFLEEMVRKNDYTLCRDDIHFMSEAANEVFPELFEAFLYAAYQDFQKNHTKPKNLVIIIPYED